MILFDGRARPVIAHRGDRAHAPENTLAAFHAAARAGADGFECDVRLTADGAVVVLHDPRVDRTTDGTGDVTALSVEWIRTLNAGAHWHAHADPDVANSPAGEDAARPFAADGLRIPLLEEVLTTFPGMPVIIECKTLDVVAPMAAVVRRVRAESRVLIGAFAAASLRAARAAGLPTIASRPELIRLLPRAVFGIRNRRPRVFRAIAMPPTYGGWTLPLRGIVRASGVPVHVWTVNDRAEATHYWEAGVNGILTDDPVTMISLRASRFSSPMLPS